jgi:putative aldouronate transport system permease protein
MTGYKSSLTDKILDISNMIFLSLFMIACMYPFYYVFIYSISDPDMIRGGITIFPAGFSLDSYMRIFMLNRIASAFTVSLARSVIGTAVTVYVSSLLAYCVTKPRLFGRKYIYRFSVITLYFNAGLIPWYITMKMFGFKDSFLLYVIPTAVNAFYVVLIKTFFEQLPPSLEESAELDGAGYFKTFIKIVFPISMPIIASIIVFSAVQQWNTWSDNFFLVINPNLQTLQLILYNYLNQAYNLSVKSTTMGAKIRLSPENIKMTITMIATLPILFVYPFMQRYFVKGIIMGAIKG